MAVEIRAAEVEEAEAIVPLYEWLFAPPGSGPPRGTRSAPRSPCGEAIESHDAVVIVADDDGALVGFCTGYQDMHSVRYGYRAWVEDLAVDPERRSEGIGKALLDAARAWAKERGATHLELDSAEPAQTRIASTSARAPITARSASAGSYRVPRWPAASSSSAPPGTPGA